MPTALWRAAKKNSSASIQITDALKEQKHLQSKQNTLLIKGFKYGSSLSIIVQKNNEAQRSQISQFFVTIITRHMSLILVMVRVIGYRNRGQNTLFHVFFVIGAQS